MSREIKFRAWNGARMLYMGKGGYSDFELAGGNIYILKGFDTHKKDYPLTQYTGLKDKNGVEIYEDDIVEWLGFAFAVTVSENHGYRFMYGLDQLCKDNAINGEVIGNIYENPELTEGN